MTDASAAFRRTRWCRPTGSVCSPGRIRADSIGASASHSASPARSAASCPPCRDSRLHHCSTAPRVSRMRRTPAYTSETLSRIARRQSSCSRRSSMLAGERGVVDDLERLGEHPVADAKPRLAGPRQHERPPVRLLPGPVAAQPQRAWIPQVPHEAVDPFPYRHPRSRIERLVLVAQGVVTRGLRAELPDEGAAGVVKREGDGRLRSAAGDGSAGRGRGVRPRPSSRRRQEPPGGGSRR